MLMTKVIYESDESDNELLVFNDLLELELEFEIYSIKCLQLLF